MKIESRNNGLLPIAFFNGLWSGSLPIPFINDAWQWCILIFKELEG